MNNQEMLPSDINDLYHVYSECGDIKSLALRYGLPKWFIRYELSIAGILPNYIVTASKKARWDIQTLRDGIRKYKSIKALAAYWGVDYSVVREALLMTGIFPQAWSRATPKQWKKNELLADLEQYSTITDIAKKYNCSRTTLLKAMEKFGIMVPAEKRRRDRTQYRFTKEQMEQDYEELRSLTAIANRYGCSLYTIWKAFDEHGIERHK